MHHLLEYFHSPLRYAIIVLLLITIAKAYKGWMSGAEYAKGDKLLALFSMILLHIQMTVGFVLYFFGGLRAHPENFAGAMKDPAMRFFTLEHGLMMLIAVALITIGRAKSKKIEAGPQKYKKIFVFYLIGFILIMLAIPWPFMRAFGSW